LAAIVLAVLAVVLLFKSFYKFGEITPITQPVDFRAFYCGAKVVSEHHDPYRVHSMAVCENAAADEFRLPHRDILPAPLPPYALYALSPLARLPFAVASPLWAFFILLAYCGSVAMLVRLTKLPTALVLASTILPSLFTSFGVGQFGPLLIVAILGTVFSLRKKNKWAFISCCACLTLEPHVALPVFLSCAIFSKISRKWIVSIAVVALAITLAMGPQITDEYFTRVLPAHAASEIDNFQQFSLANAMWSLGVPAHLALTVGTVSYVAMLLLGLSCAGLLYRQTNDIAYIVLVPVAFITLAGPFIHIAQIATAIPLAFYIVARAGKHRAVAILAATLLAVPIQPILFWSATIGPFIGGSQRIPTNIERPPIEADPIFHAKLENPTAIDSIVAGPFEKTTLLPKVPTWLALLLLLFVTIQRIRAQTHSIRATTRHDELLQPNF